MTPSEDEDLRALLRRARTVAVVGLSPNPMRPSNSVARYLQGAGYRMVPVNPGHNEILGEKSYRTLSDAARDHTIDVVDVFRRSENAGAVVDEAIPLRPQLIWLQQGVVDAAAQARASKAGMPFVPQALLRALIEGATGGAGSYDAFLPESSGRRGLEPLCAVYGPACGPAIERRLETGDLKAISFHADVRVGILSLAQVRGFGDPDELFFNVNTPDDLQRAEALWRRRV